MVDVVLPAFFPYPSVSFRGYSTMSLLSSSTSLLYLSVSPVPDCSGRSILAPDLLAHASLVSLTGFVRPSECVVPLPGCLSVYLLW